METVNQLPKPLGSNCTYVYAEADCKGFGSFGAVFKATVTESGDYRGDKIVAVKKARFEIQDPKPLPNKTGDVPEIFKNLDKLLHLRHGNVVSFYKITCIHLDSGMAIIEIMMDYLAGGNLRHTITDCRKNSRKWTQETMLTYAMQLAEGLDYLHQNRILHGDIKPENILLNRHWSPVDDQVTLIIGDLDSSIQLQQTLTCSMDVNGLLGSVRYMSPEILKRFSGVSADVIGRKTDVWSLGCVLHEMFDCGFGIDDRWLCKNSDMFRITDTMNSTIRAMKIVDGFVPFISSSIPETLSAILHSCLKPDVSIRITSSSLVGELQKCRTTNATKYEPEDIVDPKSHKNPPIRSTSLQPNSLSHCRTKMPIHNVSYC